MSCNKPGRGLGNCLRSTKNNPEPTEPEIETAVDLRTAPEVSDALESAMAVHVADQTDHMSSAQADHIDTDLHTLAQQAESRTEWSCAEEPVEVQVLVGAAEIR